MLVVGLGALSTAGCSGCTIRMVPEDLPDGGVGHPYFYQLKAKSEGYDCGKLSFVLVGNLPPGMKLSDDGAIDGTPFQAGTYTFSVYAWTMSESDYGSDSWSADPQSYTITIGAS